MAVRPSTVERRGVRALLRPRSRLTSQSLRSRMRAATAEDEAVANESLGDGGLDEREEVSPLRGRLEASRDGRLWLVHLESGEGEHRAQRFREHGFVLVDARAQREARAGVSVDLNLLLVDSERRADE